MTNAQKFALAAVLRQLRASQQRPPRWLQAQLEVVKTKKIELI